MGYRIGKYIFQTKEEYEAGKRDTAKLQRIRKWKSGTSQAQIARNYRAQIAALNLKFESKIGEDFLRLVELSASGNYDISSFELNKKRQKETRRKLIIRQGILLPLYAFLGGAVMTLAIYFYSDFKSLRELKGMQESVAAAELEANAPDQLTQSISSDSKEDDDESENNPQILEQLSEAYAKNPNLCGWLMIPGTTINYPVMYKEGDNDFYLSHNFSGEPDKNGLLVLDKRCVPGGEGVHDLIHGHNMSSGDMFGTLKYYTDEEYAKEHPLIVYSTLYEKRIYEILSVFRSSVYDEDSTDFAYYDYIEISNEEQFNEYIKAVKAESLFDTGVDAVWQDQLLSLSTCEYSKENGRLVIVARKIQ